MDRTMMENCIVNVQERISVHLERLPIMHLAICS